MNTISGSLNILLADNRYITSAGWRFIFNQRPESFEISVVINKTEIFNNLELLEINLVILDYELFDFNNIDELIELQQKYKSVHWLFFSDVLNEDFIDQLLINSNKVSILLKDSSPDEYNAFLNEFIKGNRYICSHISNILINSKYNNSSSSVKKIFLTATETEILKEISLGKTTKEIAVKRHISIHTVMTHRKNIFRKIEVNSVHEATKYAMRAGIVELAEYYI